MAILVNQGVTRGCFRWPIFWRGGGGVSHAMDAYVLACVRVLEHL